jgi:hypothetical protein
LVTLGHPRLKTPFSERENQAGDVGAVQSVGGLEMVELRPANSGRWHATSAEVSPFRLRLPVPAMIEITSAVRLNKPS